MLKAIGFDDDALARPIIGVATCWIETMPCNFNHRALAQKVKQGIRDAGGTPMEFNTISVSDGVTMGTEGMRGSLVSREVIADSIELVARSHGFDGVVCLVACDKTGPAAAMALARLERPGLIFYTGSIAPGVHNGNDVTVMDVYEGIGAYIAGTMSAEELHDLEDEACPGAGACGGQFTANTMAMALEFLGLSPTPAGRHPGHAHLEGRRRRRGRSHDHGPRRPRRPRVRSDHPRVARERACERRRDGRLDERRDASDRNRARARDPADARGRRPRDEADADRREPAARRQYNATDLFAAGGSALVAARARPAGPPPRRFADRRRAHDRRTRGQRGSTPGQQVVVSIAEPIKPNGGLARALGQPRTRGLPDQARRSRHPSLPRACACVRLGGRVLRGSQGAPIAPATSS